MKGNIIIIEYQNFLNYITYSLANINIGQNLYLASHLCMIFSRFINLQLTIAVKNKITVICPDTSSVLSCLLHYLPFIIQFSMCKIGIDLNQFILETSTSYCKSPKIFFRGNHLIDSFTGGSLLRKSSYLNSSLRAVCQQPVHAQHLFLYLFSSPHYFSPSSTTPSYLSFLLFPKIAQLPRSPGALAWH